MLLLERQTGSDAADSGAQGFGGFQAADGAEYGDKHILCHLLALPQDFKCMKIDHAAGDLIQPGKNDLISLRKPGHHLLLFISDKSCICRHS